MTQSGYGFRQLRLSPPADFYALAKRADKLQPNSAAKALLRIKHLIPKKHALYLRAANLQTEVTLDSSYRKLLERIYG